MSSRLSIWVLLLLSGIGLGALQAAGVSEQQADAFSQEDGNGEAAGNPGISGVQGTNRTALTHPFHANRNSTRGSHIGAVKSCRLVSASRA